jgi:SAM-dependent methyltransferase
MNQVSKNYEFLCEIYDEIMNNGANYDSWFNLVAQICSEKNYGDSAKILELGGGTGILGRKLKDYGFDYHGSDISFDMAKAAKRKNLDFVCADSQNIPFKNNFDLVIFLFDGINYIFDLDGFIKTFQQVNFVLKNGGCFLFDITTETNSLANFLNYREAFAGDNYAYIRESYYDGANREQHNDFDIFIEKKDDTYIRKTEKHCQKVHCVESVKNSIPKEIFEIEGIWGNFNREKYSKASNRVHFLLRKR